MMRAAEQVIMYFSTSRTCSVLISHTFAVLSIEDEHNSEPREDIAQLVTVLEWPVAIM